jgi:hypothetical protein
VKSRFRTGNQETFVIVLDSGEEYRYTCQCQQEYADGALDVYQLLPFSVNSIRIGDPVFHPGRNSYGRAVGLLFGKESKLVVLLHDETLLLTALPESRQIPENKQLTAKALEILEVDHQEMIERIHLEAGQGILYARGTCPSLPMARKFKETLDSVPHSRGTVVLLSVEPSVRVSDAILEEQLFDLLLSPSFPVFQVKIHCDQGIAVIELFSRQENISSLLYSRIEAIPGIRGLQLNIRHRPQEEMGERDKAQVVAHALRRNATLRDSRIRIYLDQGIIHLEGAVTSSLQRNAAGLAARWAGRNFRVENLIRIVKTEPSSPAFIKVS